MEYVNEEILDVLEIFLEIFEIPLPQSIDLGQWWSQVINEIEIDLLYLLYDNNILGRYDNNDLIFMNNLLSNRIKEIEIMI